MQFYADVTPPPSPALAGRASDLPNHGPLLSKPAANVQPLKQPGFLVTTTTSHNDDNDDDDDDQEPHIMAVTPTQFARTTRTCQSHASFQPCHTLC